jgi:RNA polymerase sigma-70 factor (ECF subfamily)
MITEIEGKTQNHLAIKQNISLSGAKSRVQKARLLLKEMLLDCCTFEVDKSGKDQL